MKIINTKKIGFVLKGIINSWNRNYLFLILFTFFCQSCSTEELLQTQIGASLDRNHQSFSGPSYPNASPDKDLNSFNLRALTSGGVMETKSTNSINFNDENFEDFENSGHIHYMAGIEFVQKKSEDAGTTITLNYLEVPLYILYQTPVTSTGNVFGGLGPYFAYGIGGNMKTDSYKTKAFDKTTGYKPFDAGLGLMAGYTITNSFSFSLDYEIGLVNIDRNPAGDKAKNRSIGLNIDYPLNKLINNR